MVRCKSLQCLRTITIEKHKKRPVMKLIFIEKFFSLISPLTLSFGNCLNWFTRNTILQKEYFILGKLFVFNFKLTESLCYPKLEPARKHSHIWCIDNLIFTMDRCVKQCLSNSIFMGFFVVIWTCRKEYIL